MIIVSIIILICILAETFNTNKYWHLTFFVFACAFFAAWCGNENNTIGLIVYSVVGLLGVILLIGAQDDLNKMPPKKKKNKYIAILLSVIGGILGLHKFYLRKYPTGAMYLLFFWSGIPLCLGIIDGIILLFTSKKKFDATYNVFGQKTSDTAEHKDVEITDDKVISDKKDLEQNQCKAQSKTTIEGTEDLVDFSKIRLGNCEAKANGTIENFTISIYINSKRYEFRSVDGDIDAYKAPSMPKMVKYMED